MMYERMKWMDKHMETLTAVLQELREGHMRVEERSWVENLGISGQSNEVTPSERSREEGIQFHSD